MASGSQTAQAHWQKASGFRGGAYQCSCNSDADKKRKLSNELKLGGGAWRWKITGRAVSSVVMCGGWGG